MPNLSQHAGNPKLHVDRLKGFLPEMLESSVKGAQFEHSLATPGAFDGRVLHVCIDGFAFDTGNYSRSVYCRGEMPPDAVILGFGSARNAGGLFNGSEISSATPVVYAEGTELDTTLPPDTQWFGFQVPRVMLREAGVTVPDGQAGAVKFDPQRLTELTHVLNNSLKLFSELTADTQLTNNHKAQIRSQLEGVFAIFSGGLGSEPESEPLSHPLHRLRVVRVARDYMDAHYAEVIRVSELGRLTGSGFRTLERAFNAVLGMSPQRYLAAVRLSKARQMLLGSQAEKSYVSDIAMACGCFHLGRFAQEYGAMFGETPSQTLKMRRR